ncbi:CHAT domain-containing protein [Streptomyces sp. BA2]|uniref:CHAT domain-containing protein n=1 Tax=Streptomyces sp. BA2 TaxID=436595 RepID=UPI001369F077|nr:CHAT domain-containing protein [Streptomyces sp. BA2]
MLAYEELRIRIRPIGTSRYLVTANGPATAAEVIAVNGEPAAFRDQWDQLISAELGLAPMGEQHTVAQLRGLGRGVFQLLFGERDPGPPRPEGIGACVGLALERAQRMRPARGLRIRFDVPEELRDLPFETLCAPPGQPQQSLALNHGYSLVRSLPGGPLGQRLPEPADEPSLIRLLVACASPVDAGLPPLRPDTEVAALRQELPEVAVRTTVVERATRKSLEAALGAHSPLPTALLLIAHGTYDQELGKGVVALETEGGGADHVPADLLSGILLKAPGLRLVALNLCSGADSSLAEPFSGLAQALIGGGVPAVVAMRGRVSDVSAGQFSPELFKGLAANRTIDEAVGAARRRISHLPGHTAVEWATPALFLHESCRQGWLFKAREVRDDGGAVADPLREGADALLAFQRPVGHVDSTVLIGAARFQRDLGQWAQVQRILRAETRQFEDEQRRLRGEAAFELAWEELEKLCALLAAERDADAVVAQFESLRDALPGPPPTCLTMEVERLRHLTGLAERARAAEEAGDWAEAVARYEELLSAHPAGLRDTASRLAEARDELHVSEAFGAAERARHRMDWASAAATYADVLARRPGHRGAVAGAAYVGGRVAQDAGEWGTAEAGYAACGGFEDSAARAAYVRGRAAAEAAEWGAARSAFAEAEAEAKALKVGGGDAPPRQTPGETPGQSPGPDLARWGAYATGRVAEGACAWSDAVEGFADAGDFLDGGVRLLYVRGRCAADREAWPEALADLEAAAAQGWDAEPWLGGLRERMYQEALDAAGVGNWTDALTSLDLLPLEYRDVRPRRCYVQGQVAASGGDWPKAADAFAECVAAGPAVEGGGLDDADALRTYAQGRLCQDESRWQDALACFARLSSDLLDVPDRLLYVRGRVADARAEWAGVIDGFGRLPDTYAHGEVRDRRRYARARVAAELRADWSAVLSLLADVPDTGRAGAVGALRRKAEGRLAEAAGDWAAACEIYARGLPAAEPEADGDDPSRQSPDPGQEPLHLHLYALARTHELSGGWADALLAYQALPDCWGDVVVRRRYAQARIAEGVAASPAEWRAVVAAFSSVEAEPGVFEDAARRRRYAQVRLSEAEGDWGRVQEGAAALGDHRDAAALGAYARGRLADAHQEWQQAADAFRRCAGHRDADAHLAYAQGRLLETAGRWSDAVAAYERAGGGLDRADARCRRLRRLLELLPWADGLTSAPLVADPFASSDPTYPYFALRDAGVDPGATMDAVNDASYTLLERGGMTWSERVAWDRLRLPARRLQLDALLYRWHSPAALRDAMAGLSPDEGVGAGLLGDLCGRFPRDAPLLLLLARDREAAAAEWERRLAAAPGDMAVVHGLAAARLWQAQELEQSGAWEHAVTAWESALAYWATLLSDDEYWDGWRAERAACYERDLASEDTAQLRLELSRYLFGQLSACEQRHTEQERPEQAAAYLELAALLEAELGAARVLKDLGGLRDVPGAGAAPLACGPRYLRLLHLEAPLGALAAALDAAAEQGKDPGVYAVRELRWAFSELAQSFVLSEVHKFEPALRALPAFATLTTLPADCAGPASATAPAEHIEACAHCQDFLRRNPAYVQLPERQTKLLQDGVELAVRVRLALSRTALTDGVGGLDRALAEWAELVRVSRRAGMQARSKKAVVTAVLGRVEALVDRGGAERGDCLDEAVTLVEAVPPVLHPLDRDLVNQLNAKLSALLSMRGVWRGYTRTKYDMRSDAYGAEADLRRALALNPASSHARDNLARALVFTLDAHTHTIPGRLEILHEALGLLDVGLGQALTHGYRETLGEALDEMERLLAQDLGVDGLRDLMRSDSEEAPPDENELGVWASLLTDRAEESLARGDIRRALHHLIRATRADPTNSRIRRALLDAVRRRLDGLIDSAAGGDEQ